jgi:DNA uptake protein ComE-like DNA-binding protein
MTTTTIRLARGCAAGVLALGLAACGGATSTPAAPSAPTPAGAAAPATASAGSAPTSARSASKKVSANTASEDEIAAALESAGVSKPERWAEEVVEYRPYPADDPDLAKLRQNLAKYNPGQETTDKIVSALAP